MSAELPAGGCLCSTFETASTVALTGRSSHWRDWATGSGESAAVARARDASPGRVPGGQEAGALAAASAALRGPSGAEELWHVELACAAPDAGAASVPGNAAAYGPLRAGLTLHREFAEAVALAERLRPGLPLFPAREAGAGGGGGGGDDDDEARLLEAAQARRLAALAERVAALEARSARQDAAVEGMLVGAKGWR